MKTQDSRLKTQDSRLKTQDSRLKTQPQKPNPEDIPAVGVTHPPRPKTAAAQGAQAPARSGRPG
ncbi:MAG: hypothetical protein FJ138_16020 [Deltaproteobacteria bacterium]|nr:hypothetical protein [Deltaproteobacteria bacterium]